MTKLFQRGDQSATDTELSAALEGMRPRSYRRYDPGVTLSMRHLAATLVATALLATPATAHTGTPLMRVAEAAGRWLKSERLQHGNSGVRHLMHRDRLCGVGPAPPGSRRPGDAPKQALTA